MINIRDDYPEPAVGTLNKKGTIHGGLLVALLVVLLVGAAFSYSDEKKSSAASFYNSARTYYDVERYDEALADYTRFIELDDQDPVPYYRRALVYSDLKQYQAEEPITFENLKSRIEDIPQVAWTNTQHLIKSNRASSSSVLDLEILVGPNTKLYFEDDKRAFADGMTLWANVKRPTKYFAFFYRFEDKSWAEQKYKKLPFYKPGMEILIDGPCDGKKCTGANSGIQAFSSVGVGVFGIHGPDAKDPYRRGPMQIHEYTHAVQMAPWIGKDHPGSEQQKISPCWLIEGQAHFAGISAGTSSFGKYKQMRKQQVQSHKVDSFTEYSSATILDYYNNDIPNKCLRSPNYRLGYTVGFLTVEALSAIGGIESSMNVYQLAASGQSFNRAFKNVYGIAWKDAKPILAEVVTLMRKKIVD